MCECNLEEEADNGRELEAQLPEYELEVQTTSDECGSLSPEALQQIELLISHMSDLDLDGDGQVTVEEAIAFWNQTLADFAYRRSQPSGGAFLTADRVRSMFADDDTNLDGPVTRAQFLAAFEHMAKSGVSSADIAALCESILENGMWGSWRSNLGHHLTAGPAWGPERNNHPLNRMVEMERCDELDEPLDETRLAMARWISEQMYEFHVAAPAKPSVGAAAIATPRR